MGVFYTSIILSNFSLRIDRVLKNKITDQMPTGDPINISHITISLTKLWTTTYKQNTKAMVKQTKKTIFDSLVFGVENPPPPGILPTKPCLTKIGGSAKIPRSSK